MVWQKILIILSVIACLEATNIRRKFISKYNVTNSDSNYKGLCDKFSYIVQNVDHFGFNNVDTYKQRYIINKDHWKGPGSPIFFYTGNEGDIQWFCENIGFVWEIAEQYFGAMVIFAEHRYYGNSMPYGKESLNRANSNYLTSEQALADYAYLIKHIKSTLNEPEKSPVIAFGGSYGGMLSAWFRMKYPNIVAGSIAASAPILQFVAECDQFDVVITNAFEKGDKLCPHIIRKSWDVINEMGKTKEGLQSLTEILKLCKPLENTQLLKDYLNDIYGNVAMANYPYATNFLSDLPAWPVKVMCEKMVDTVDKHFHADHTKFMTAVYNGINVYSNFTGQLKCNSVDSDIPGINMDSWTYQTCTEFVFPMCANGKADMFEPMQWDDASYNLDCKKSFDVTPKSEWPLYTYGGSLDELKYHSNIVFSNGDLDPWYSGGVVETINDKLPAIVIKDGAHHLDLRASNKDDTESVKAARFNEIKYIQQWINEYNQTI